MVAAAGLLAVPSLSPAGSVLEVQGTNPGRAVAHAPRAAASPITAPVMTPDPVAMNALLASAADAVGGTLDASGVTIGPPPVSTGPMPVALLTGYQWPLAHPRLTLPFGPTPWGSRVVGGKLFHDGVDLATFCGDRVLAAHAGVVLAAGRRYDGQLGWAGDLARYYARLDRQRIWYELPIVVVIDDGDGYRSIYAHFSRIKVSKGDTVRSGQLLGYEGMTGHASGCHVHYGLFSPLETATFRIKGEVARRMRLPVREIARVDPLLVLPPRAGINAPRHQGKNGDGKEASTSP